MSKEIIHGGATNHMSLGCAERAYGYLIERWLFHQGLTADVTIRERTPQELAELVRQKNAEKEQTA